MLHPSRLDDFLAKRVSESGSGQETHQLGGSRINYRILPEEMKEFRELYCEYINARCPTPTLFEKLSQGIAPLRVDLDLNYKGKHSTPFHTREHTKAFIEAYMTEVAKYLVIKDITDVYVMEKSYPTWYPGKDQTKSGIHIVIPSLMADALSLIHI